MSYLPIVLLIITGVLLLAGSLLGLVVFALFLVKRLGGSVGEWRRLADHYPTQQLPNGQITNRETIQIGAVTYKRCVILGIADEGLYVSIGNKTALIPWNEFTAIGQTTLYWQKLPMLTAGDPPVATMTLPLTLFQEVRSRLPETLTRG